MVAYLDSSVVLRHILRGESSIRRALAFPRVVSSELLEIECRRVLHRYRMSGDLTDEGVATASDRLETVLSGIDLFEMTAAVKKRAMEPFPVVIGTLDALHIATALLLSQTAGTASVFSHDAQMNVCARTVGLLAALA